FIDFSKTRQFSNHSLGGATFGIGLQHFLFQILLGAELLVRLRKEPITTSYAGIVTDNISALIVLSALWMKNVLIQGPNTTTGSTQTNTTLPQTRPRYLLVATEHRQQAEGLIRFGEAMAWPLMEEARSYIETAYQTLTSRGGSVGFDMCDWLFGLILP